MMAVKFDFIFLNSHNRDLIRKAPEGHVLMLKMNASINICFRKIFLNCLILLIALFECGGIAIGQEKSGRMNKPNLAEPFKRCRVFGGNTGLTRILASDNEFNVIFTNDNFWIISLNPDTNLENWKTQTGGKLEGEAVSDETNLYFLTSFENESGEKNYTLNSISSKTGITSWQKKLTTSNIFSLNQSKNRDLLFLKIGEKSLTAVSKDSGEIRWTKEFTTSLVTVDTSKPAHLGIVLEDRLIRISTASGNVLDETKLKKSPVTSSVINGSYFLLGYSNGEIRSVSAGENEVLWKIKTGAGISGIAEYEEQALVTSLDNFIYLFSLSGGKLKWKKRVAGRINFKPLILGDFALVVNTGDNSTSVIDLRDGKVVNQISLEQDIYFSGQPFVIGSYIVLQTSKGLQMFANTNNECK